jgi:hypothetical protein
VKARLRLLYHHDLQDEGAQTSNKEHSIRLTLIRLESVAVVVCLRCARLTDSAGSDALTARPRL